MHWRERWEYEANLEAQNFKKISEQNLLNRVIKGNLGNYYQIWHELGRKGTLEKSALVLLQFLQQHPGDNIVLHRYHCAAALLKIIYKVDSIPTDEMRKQIQWDHEGEEMRQQKLLELRQIITDKLDEGT